MGIYVKREDIISEFDGDRLIYSLDDNGDGSEDEGLFDSLATSVDAIVASHADMIRKIGFPPLPETFLRYCGRVFMCAMLVRRKGAADEMNPFAGPEREIRQRLERIESGEINIRPKTFTMLTTMTTFHRFGPRDMQTSATSDSAGDVVLPGPDGKKWRLKIKYLSGKPVHYWEEVTS